MTDNIPPEIDLVAHLAKQSEWSCKTFGPGKHTKGVIDHIRRELAEIEAAPDDLAEWIDVAILAFDGAWRTGATPQQIAEALVAKQSKNEARTWPDWRTADPDKAIEHVRSLSEIADEGSAPAPVRISPEVRETILTALHDAIQDDWSMLSAFQIKAAIAFVEALP